MGFMDKAKKLAEQAQQKVEETQEKFNASQGQGSTPAEPVQQYDSAGRPIASSAPPPPHGDPAAVPDPAAPAPQPDLQAQQPPPTGATPPHGDQLGEAIADSPKPPAPPSDLGPAAPSGSDGDYTPPKLSSGDPLAG